MVRPMRVLVACEESGRVRTALRILGHDAVSLDLLPSASGGPHRVEPLTPDVLAEGWDMVIAFPPCTHLSAIGAAHWKRFQAEGLQQAAFGFVQMIWNSPVPMLALENPIGWLNTNWLRPTQIIDPWWFRDPYAKRTCLWLRGLPGLVPDVPERPNNVISWVDTQRGRKDPVTGRRVVVRNGTPRGRGDADRSRIRARTFTGVAWAMASQWAGTAVRR